jgi:hypothetical protein
VCESNCLLETAQALLALYADDEPARQDAWQIPWDEMSNVDRIRDCAEKYWWSKCIVSPAACAIIVDYLTTDLEYIKYALPGGLTPGGLWKYICACGELGFWASASRAQKQIYFQGVKERR